MSSLVAFNRRVSMNRIPRSILQQAFFVTPINTYMKGNIPAEKGLLKENIVELGIRYEVVCVSGV